MIEFNGSMILFHSIPYIEDSISQVTPKFLNLLALKVLLYTLLIGFTSSIHCNDMIIAY